ncbi:hypothetical protein [Fodinicurvata fenggangensis]|uniref:hypothetical protein n=1 Tax=Fodinicurvata fenggangensis TaxID=1121830 RepID=UPI000479210C|nr:hypothetical protein [Fodinicurvata fenggangensis]
MQNRQPGNRDAGQQEVERWQRDWQEELEALAERLSSRVAWGRMSTGATRRALGLPPPACRERREHEAGRLDRAAGCRRPRQATLAYRSGFRSPRLPGTTARAAARLKQTGEER